MRDPKCQKCELHSGCQSVCLWGAGAQHSPLMIVGEVPGPDEDAEGRPFVGRSGQLLDHCLGYLSLKREDVYLTYAVRCRPPEGKLPGTQEGRRAIIEACTPYFDAEFQALKPRVILALGKTALEVLSKGGTSDISQWQGRMWGFYHKSTARLYAAYHPAFILQKPSEERRLTAAIKTAAMAAGLPVKWNENQPVYNYDDFRS